jgi:hypothetical protein
MTKGRAVTLIWELSDRMDREQPQVPFPRINAKGLHQFKVLVLVLEIFARIGQY